MEDINQFNLTQTATKGDENRYLIMETGKYTDTEFINDCGTYANLQLSSDMLGGVSVSNHIDTSAQDFLQCVTSSSTADKHYNVLTPTVTFFSHDPKEYNNTLLTDNFSHISHDQSAVALTLAGLAEYSKESLQTFCENQTIPSVGLSSLNSPLPETVVTKESAQTYIEENVRPIVSLKAETKSDKTKHYDERKENRKLVTPTGCRMIDLDSLVNSLSSILLCDCGDGNYNLFEDLNESDGYYSALKFICSSCDRMIDFDTCSQKENIFDINKKTELILESLDITETFLGNILKQYDLPFYKPQLEDVSDKEPDDAVSPESPISMAAEIIPTEPTPKPKDSTKPIACFYCSESFVCRKTFFNHLRKHAEKAPLLCTGCTKTFASPSTLFKHLKVHNPSLHKCKTCGKEFKKPFNLKQHVRIHTGEKPFLCSECGKSFSDASTFRKHKLGSHSNERKLQCPICSKSFYHQGHLKEHKRTHTRERPFSCQVCSKVFMYKDSLKKHMVVHSGEQMFNCEQCNKQFRWRESLRQHMKTHKNTNESAFNELPSIDTNAMTPGLLLFSPNTEQQILKPSSVPFSNEIFLL